MIPHPRRVYSCHGDGGTRLGLGRRSLGCMGEILLVDGDGQIRTVVCAEATLAVRGNVVHLRSRLINAHSLADIKPLFRIGAAPHEQTSDGLGSDPCDPPAAREPYVIPKDEPKPARCLKYIPRIEAAIATIDGLSGRLLRVSANGCGLMFAEVEVRHVNGGVAVLRVEFAWHHRVYASCSWVMPAPLAVTMAVGDALALAFAGGMDEDSEW